MPPSKIRCWSGPRASINEQNDIRTQSFWEQDCTWQQHHNVLNYENSANVFPATGVAVGLPADLCMGDFSTSLPSSWPRGFPMFGFCMCQTPMCHQRMFVRCRKCKSNTLVGASGLWTSWCYWGRAVSMPLGDPRSSAWPTTCLVFLDEQRPRALCPRGSAHRVLWNMPSGTSPATFIRYHVRPLHYHRQQIRAVQSGSQDRIFLFRIFSIFQHFRLHIQTTLKQHFDFFHDIGPVWG